MLMCKVSAAYIQNVIYQRHISVMDIKEIHNIEN